MTNGFQAIYPYSWVFVLHNNEDAGNICTNINLAKERLREAAKKKDKQAIDLCEKALFYLQSTYESQKKSNSVFINETKTWIQIAIKAKILISSFYIGKCLSGSEKEKFYEIIEILKRVSFISFYNFLKPLENCFNKKHAPPHMLLISALLHECFEKTIHDSIEYYIKLCNYCDDKIIILDRIKYLVEKDRIKSNDHEFCYFHILDLLYKNNKLCHENLDSLLKAKIEQLENIQNLFKNSLNKLKEEVQKQEISSKDSKKNPECFICFSLDPEEEEIKFLIENYLIPDMKKVNIQPVYSRYHLAIGDPIIKFEKKITNTEKAVIICTSSFKRKIEDRNFHPTGVAHEFDLAELFRKGNSELFTNTFMLYFEEDRRNCTILTLFSGNLSIKFQRKYYGIYNYYDNIFQILAAMLDPDKGSKIITNGREKAHSISEFFFKNVKAIMSGKIIEFEKQ